jgi:hypothetical protein
MENIILLSVMNKYTQWAKEKEENKKASGLTRMLL